MNGIQVFLAAYAQPLIWLAVALAMNTIALPLMAIFIRVTSLLVVNNIRWAPWIPA